MSQFPAIEALKQNQEQMIRKMMALSIVVHAAAFLLGSALSPLFPTRQASPPGVARETRRGHPEISRCPRHSQGGEGRRHPGAELDQRGACEAWRFRTFRHLREGRGCDTAAAGSGGP